MGEGFAYERWLMVKKAMSDTEEGSDTTWSSVKAILNFVLAYVLKKLKKESSHKRENILIQNMNIINEKLMSRNKHNKTIYTN